MTQPLDHKVIIVTGAASGIGRACAIDLARHGARVVVSDVEAAREGAEETLRLIEEVVEGARVSSAKGNGDHAVGSRAGTSRGSRAEAATAVAESPGAALFIACDVTDAAQVKHLVDETVATFGRLDAAVNNAGVGGASKPTAEYGEAEWDWVMAVNLRGVFLCMKHEIEAMANPQTGEARGGSIVNVSSILGHVGFASAPAYVAAKHGVEGLTKAAAVDHAEQGIRINSVCPAFIITPMLEQAGLMADPEVRQHIESLHPMGRMGRPEEVAGLVTWLCSDASTFVTGASYLVDGGYTAR